MKKRLLSALIATSMLLTSAQMCIADELINVSEGKNMIYSDGKYTLDLGRAYPIENIRLSGTDVANAKVTASNDADFAPKSVGSEINISAGKPIKSKLYGSGGYSTFVSANANDGDESTMFIATPVSYTDVEWLTIDLGSACAISSATVKATTTRSYSVYLSNYYYEPAEEFKECIKMEEKNGSFYVPEQHQYDKFRYARLVFDAAPNSNGKDIRLYEFSVFSNGGNSIGNLAQEKSISSKLYGSGGYNGNVVANANDGNASTLFYATPVRYTDVEWVTVDLGSRCVIGSAEVTATTERSYDVYLTNVSYGQTEEFSDYVKMEKQNGIFYMPDEHASETYRYARLVFDAAKRKSGKDIQLYEFSIYSSGNDTAGRITERTTTVFNKSSDSFVPNAFAKKHYYRYIKVSGASGVNKIDVFSKPQTEEYTNIAPYAELSMPDGATVYGDLNLSSAVDENYFTITALNHNNPYVQLDLKKAYDISHTEVYFRQDLNTDRECVRVLLSNDPQFNSFYELDAQWENETFGGKGALVSVNKSRFDNYRYVRVYEGKSKSFLVLSQIRVFAKDGHGDVSNMALGKIPNTNADTETAYRITDGDLKTFWEGKSATIDLGYCRDTDMVEITGCGDINVTFSCDGEIEDTTELTLEKDVPEAVSVNKKIRYIDIESADNVRINEVKASAKNGKDRLVKVDCAQTQENSEYIYDLGSEFIIDHIEPCGAQAYVANKSDFSDEKRLETHSDKPISGRYIRSQYDDIDVYAYPLPKLVIGENEATLKYDKEQYTANEDGIALCAGYGADGQLVSLVKSSTDDGEIAVPENEDSENTKLMLWNSMENMKPLVPAVNAVVEYSRPWKEFYVSQGATGGDGTEEAPFGTIAEAKNYIKRISSKMQGDIYVYIKGGRYLLGETLSFTAADSGKNGYNIIYKNYNDEIPEISGGRYLPSFEQGDNGLWQAYVPNMSEIYGLLVNGQPAQLAHTENTITAEEIFGSGTYNYAGIAFSDDKLPYLSNGSDVYVRAVKSWIDNYFRAQSVETVNGNTRISINTPNFNTACASSVHPLTAESEYTIENAFELLDNPGEFYFNKNTKTLYYMPRQGENINTAVAEAPYLDTLVQIKGSGESNKAHNISFSGLKFENATYHDVYKGGFRVAQADLAVIGTGEGAGKQYSRFFDGTIHLAYADSINISDCELSNFAKAGVSMEIGVTNTAVCNNRIYNTGTSAISCGRPWHEYIAEAQVCANNKAYNNIISNTGTLNRSAPAIAFYFVRDCDISHNSITDASYSAISLGWGWSSYPDSVVCRRNRVMNNYIHNFNLWASDGGAIYTLGQQSGTVIDGNYIVMDKEPRQNFGSVGIYPDEGSKYMTIKNNVIDVGIDTESNNIYTISLWQSSIGYNFVHSNYATVDKVRDKSTESIFEGVCLYDRNNIPDRVNDIIRQSAREYE